VKRSALLGLVLANLLLQEANAGSAVAMGSNGYLVYSYGLPRTVAVRHVISICTRRGGVNVRLLASTDIVGEGAIAIARSGKKSIFGVSLGRRSATEAQARAIKQCRKAGGIDPVVRWGFRG
jgi:hypothetical protein